MKKSKKKKKILILNKAIQSCLTQEERDMGCVATDFNIEYVCEVLLSKPLKRRKNH